MQHRGRIQAQGETLEESESWAQELPLLYVDGTELLVNLEKKMTQKELKIRKKGLAQCRQVMLNASKNGGIRVADMGKIFIQSYPKKQKERIDLEVHLGIAFVTTQTDETDK